jgi:phytanoyl-CoA hydroxylase
MLLDASPIEGDQIDHFRQHGYVFVPHFWDARIVAAMVAESERLVAAGLVRNVATEGDGSTHSETSVNLQLDPIVPHSLFFRMLAYHHRAAAAVEALLGGPVLLEEDQLFWKPGDHGAGTNWHTDNAYFSLDDPRAGTAMWTAIHDATVENGTLRVVPDAFREHWEHHRDLDSDHHIRTTVGDRDVAYAELEAGGVAFFCYGTPHATGGNSSGRARAAVAYHYTRADHSSSTPALNPAVTGPKADPNAWDDEIFTRLVDRIIHPDLSGSDGWA